MSLPLDSRDLLVEFDREEVEYALIGGYASETVLRNAIAATWDDVCVWIIAIDDLIANKRASGRAGDLADLKQLERVRDRRG